MNLRNLILFLLIALFAVETALADVGVKGYYRNNGTYVPPHYRSNPNNTTDDNWSTKGNRNPSTGENGTHKSDNNSWGNGVQ